MRHKKTIFFLLIYMLFLSFFIPSVLSIVNENDINFDWITTQLYNQQNPYDFEVDDSLNPTVYNNTDYFEHQNSFDSNNFTDDYLLDEYIITSGIECIYYFNNSYNLLDGNGIIYIYNNSMGNTGNTISLIGNFNFDTIISVIIDNSYIYVLITYGIYYQILLLDDEYNYLNTVLSIDNSVYNFYKICYFDNYIYVLVNVVATSDTYVLEYDFSGSLINSYDVSTNVDTGKCFYQYQSRFYIYDQLDDDVHVYDDSFVFIETFALSSISMVDIYIYNDLVFYIDDLIADFLEILNIDFTQEDYYDKIYYYPDENGLFDGVNNLNVSMEIQTNNISYQNPDLIYQYNASYTFTNDIDGNVPIGWVSYDTGTCSSTKESSYNYHDDVLKLLDNSGSSVCDIRNTFSAQTYGTVELWMLSNDCTGELDIDLMTGATYSGIIMIRDDLFKYYDKAYYTFSSSITPIDDQWYHIRIDYECGAGGYLGLSADTGQLIVNGVNQGIFTFNTPVASIDTLGFRTITTHQLTGYFDGIGYSWLANYTIGNNLNTVDITFDNEIEFMDDSYQSILNIKCVSGIYLINNDSIDYNVYLNVSNSWNINITILQQTQNGTLYVYNESNALLFSYNFATNNANNIKYIKYRQYYQDTIHFVHISNFTISSNNTIISGKNGFLSYELDLIDTNVWNFQISSSVVISGNGRYRFYVSNESYDINDNITQISGWIDFVNETKILQIGYIIETIVNPFLIVETMNGMYVLNSIMINASITDFIIYDDRDYFTLGSFTSSNVNTDNSYFYVVNSKLHYQIIFDDSNEEYIKLTFDIPNINNENYQFLYTTYKNSSETSVLFEIKLKQNDFSYTSINIDAYYQSSIETLEQQKTTTQIEFLISDNNLQDNLSLSGYIEGFTFNYNEQISISLFVEQMLIMLIPLITILSLTFGISIALKDKKSRESLNTKAFFPIFLISSIIVFVLGFFETWILFSIIISAIIYLIKKRDDGI